jgi:hypothetical protein
VDTKVQSESNPSAARIPRKPFTLHREKGCAVGPFLLKESAKTRKKP